MSVLLQANVANTAHVFCDNMLTQTYLLINALISRTNELVRITGCAKDIVVAADEQAAEVGAAVM